MPRLRNSSPSCVGAQRGADRGGHPDQVPSGVEIDILQPFVAQRDVEVVGRQSRDQRDHQPHDQTPAGLVWRAVEMNRCRLNEKDTWLFHRPSASRSPPVRSAAIVPGPLVGQPPQAHRKQVGADRRADNEIVQPIYQCQKQNQIGEIASGHTVDLPDESLGPGRRNAHRPMHRNCATSESDQQARTGHKCRPVLCAAR